MAAGSPAASGPGERQPNSVRLLLCGDVMLGRGLDQVLPHPVEPRLLEPQVRDARVYVQLAERRHGPIPAPVSPAYPWGDALAAIEAWAPDHRLINLETAMTADGRPWPHKAIHYRMHPAHGEVLRVAGIDCCALANNHVLDWGEVGLRDTLTVLAQSGIAVAGAGCSLGDAVRPAVLSLAGGRRLLVSAWATASSGVPAAWAARARSCGIALLEDLEATGVDQVRGAVQAQRRPGDRVLVSLHWGANWVDRIPERHRRFARGLLAEGIADAIWGHSAHHPLPIELVDGRLILYGCGDLINDYEGIEALYGDAGHHATDLGLLHLVTLSATDGRLLDLRLLPFRRRRFRLEPADQQERKALLERLQPGCRSLGTRLVAHRDGGFALLPA